MSDKVIYHSHHIFPRHTDPEGIFDDYRIKVTVEEHAEIHGLLYDEYGRWQDWVAWRQLSTQISIAEALKQTQKFNATGNKWNLGRKHTLESILKMKRNHHHTKHSSITREIISSKKKGSIPWNKGKKGIYSLETR